MGDPDFDWRCGDQEPCEADEGDDLVTVTVGTYDRDTTLANPLPTSEITGSLTPDWGGPPRSPVQMLNDVLKDGPPRAGGVILRFENVPTGIYGLRVQRRNAKGTLIAEHVSVVDVTARPTNTVQEVDAPLSSLRPAITFRAPIPGVFDPAAAALTGSESNALQFAAFDNADSGPSSLHPVLRNTSPDEADNVAGGDSNRFYLRVRDRERAAESTVEVDWWTDSKPALKTYWGPLTLTLDRIDAEQGIFVSRGLVLVNRSEDIFELHSGRGSGMRSPGDKDYRILRAALGSQVQASYVSKTGIAFETSMRVFPRAERRSFRFRVTQFLTEDAATDASATEHIKDSVRFAAEVLERLNVELLTESSPEVEGATEYSFAPYTILQAATPVWMKELERSASGNRSVDQPLCDELVRQLAARYPTPNDAVNVFYPNFPTYWKVYNLANGASVTLSSAVIPEAIGLTVMEPLGRTPSLKHELAHELVHHLSDKPTSNGHYESVDSGLPGLRYAPRLHLMLPGDEDPSLPVGSIRLWDVVDAGGWNYVASLRASKYLQKW